jgi:hypothetical protein
MPGAPALGQGGQQPILNVSPTVSIVDRPPSLPKHQSGRRPSNQAAAKALLLRILAYL